MVEFLIEINWYCNFVFLCYLDMVFYDLGLNDVDVMVFLNEVFIMKDFNYFNVFIFIGIIFDKGEFLMVILFFM